MNISKRTMALLALSLASTALVGVAPTGTADPCNTIDTSSLDVEGEAGALVACVASAWDPGSTLLCNPGSFSETEQVPGDSCSSNAVDSEEDRKCGYGWAQSWHVEVELTQGDARVSGQVICDSHTKAECTIKIGGVRVCTDDGGSEHGPIDCLANVEDIAKYPVEGTYKCVDPLDPSTAIIKAFHIVGLEAPVTLS